MLISKTARKCALNTQYALNNERQKLITVYGILIQSQISDFLLYMCSGVSVHVGDGCGGTGGEGRRWIRHM